jgi:hypothetical protein
MKQAKMVNIDIIIVRFSNIIDYYVQYEQKKIKKLANI